MRFQCSVTWSIDLLVNTCDSLCLTTSTVSSISFNTENSALSAFDFSLPEPLGALTHLDDLSDSSSYAHGALTDLDDLSLGALSDLSVLCAPGALSGFSDLCAPGALSGFSDLGASGAVSDLSVLGAPGALSGLYVLGAPGAVTHGVSSTANTASGADGTVPTMSVDPGFLAPTKNSVILRNDEFSSVINLSSLTLTRDQLSVLNLGLNFCPVPKEVNLVELKQDFKQFARKLRLREFFCKQETEPYTPRPFKPVSTFTPPPNRCKFLDTYLTSVETRIFTEASENKDFHRNLSSGQLKALRDLQSNTAIVIRDADKGSGVVIMDRDRYIAEATRQLSDNLTYAKLSSDPSPMYAKELEHLVVRLAKNGTIDEDMAAYALPEDHKPGRLYLLPKVHKAGVPGRPVISCSGALTEHVSEIVDHLIKPLLPHVTSYLRDTKDFVSKMRDLDTYPEDAILASLDVVNLYPSIPHDDGIDALNQFLRRHGFTDTQTEDICDLAYFILTHNHFEFNSEMYLQMAGTAMGTRMAPTYAIIFMHMQETALLQSVPLTPFLWLRFIDDIFCLWTHGEAAFQDFFTRINQGHASIKFTREHSRQEVPFLDVLVQKTEENKVSLDLYTKPTDTHMYLHPASCHPGHVKRSIAYSQAIRILNICTSRDTAMFRLEKLVENLTARGHSNFKVRKEVNKAIEYMDKPRPYPDPEAAARTPDRVNFVLTYHPGLPDINKILRENHHILHLNKDLKAVVPAPPRLAFRKPQNLRDQLCRARLPSTEPRTDHHCGPCSDNVRRTRGPKCAICKLMPTQTSIKSASNGKISKLKLRNSADCTSNYVVYCLTCTLCNLQYVGKAENFRLRVNNHKSCINRHKADDRGCRILYEHFAQTDHSIECVKFTILEQCNNGETLKCAEKRWIWSLETVFPKGLNADDGFGSHLTASRR